MYKVVFAIILILIIGGNYMIFGKLKKQSKMPNRFSIPRNSDTANEISNTDDNSLASKLNRLVKMKDEGIITDDQFQIRRREIIEHYMD